MNSCTGAVLIVDDDLANRRVLRALSLHAGFQAAEAESGEEALRCIRAAAFDAVLINILLPGLNGIEFFCIARKKFPRLPIIVLSVQNNEDRIVEALDAGADDYVIKPFGMRELTARIRAAVRHGRMPEEDTAAVISIGEITLDPSTHKVCKNGRRIHVTPKEFGLLKQLMLHAGEPVSHARLLQSVWGLGFDEEVEYLRTFMHNLRVKLEDNPALPRYLVSDLAYGYRFVDATQSE